MSIALADSTTATPAAVVRSILVPKLTAEEVHTWLHQPDDNIAKYGPQDGVTCGSCNKKWVSTSYNDGYDHHYWYERVDYDPDNPAHKPYECEHCQTFLAAAVKAGWQSKQQPEAAPAAAQQP
jgi:hypothetical protein